MSGQTDWTDGQTGRLNVDGTALEWACWGPAPADAPTLVLLHEGLGCVALWRDFPKALAAATGFGVFAYSRAGYGRSDPATLPRPLDYMTREAMDVLPSVLDQIGFQRGLLVGHSDGASIAAIYGGSVFDARVRGLILIAPHFFTEPSGLDAIRAARTKFATTDLPDRMAAYHRDAGATFSGWNDAWLDPGFEDWNITDAIDHLRVPVLAIQGTRDPYGTPAQIAELEQRSYAPVDVLMLPDCEHAPHLEQPQIVQSAIAEFLTRLERIEGAETGPT